ncbi:abc transporter [Penicillium sp. IBT 16267x]|nr:abc transporter [Penicillium sp. IBT 16267x]
MFLQIIQRGVFFAISTTITQRSALTEDMVFLTMYWPGLAATLSRLPLQYGRMISHFADTKRLLAHFDIQPTVQDIKNAQAIADGDGYVELNHVSFSYNSAGTALRDICISIAPKTTFGLVGVSGSGKSTILKLILRLFDVASGNIKIDGQDIRKVTQESLREAVVFIPSGNYSCQHRSIRQILEYANPGVDTEQIFEACRAAKIHDDIWALPKQYDSVFGTDLCLSDGQMQRIGIARAFIKSPRILVLDEPTSYLDPWTEAAILENLKRLNCTIILSANRLSTVKQADQIAVL